MPFDSSASQKLAPYLAYVCTDQGAAVACAVVEQSGGSTSALHGGGLSGAARLGSGAPQAATVLAEIGNIPVEMACECVTEICRTGVNVIVVGEQTDLATYRALRRAGALEYFGFPVSAAEILAARPEEPMRDNIVQMPLERRKSPSIAVMGSNGGVGASLLAQNLAFHLAGAKGANLRTALLDADLHFGSQAIDLDREETDGLFEALLAPDRLDDTFIAATMDHLTERLSLYSNQISIGQDAAPYERGLRGLVSQLRKEFGALVADVPRATMIQNDDLVQQFDALVLVIPAGFSGVNAASRIIKRLAAQNPDLRIVPVLSDIRRDAGLSLKDVQKTIGLPVVATLPRCDAQLARAHRAARPLIELYPRSPYAQAVRVIWSALQSSPKPSAKPAARPLLKRFFA
ncbi:CpaE family protein [Marivita sp. S2033]|uniref:AAA family ATPase n=1 Tax=Marivita sp. S2033 TaxID=3373187 RepID=UPI0039828501